MSNTSFTVRETLETTRKRFDHAAKHSRCVRGCSQRVFRFLGEANTSNEVDIAFARSRRGSSDVGIQWFLLAPGQR